MLTIFCPLLITYLYPLLTFVTEFLFGFVENLDTVDISSKVERADLMCDVIKKVAPFVLSKI